MANYKQYFKIQMNQLIIDLNLIATQARFMVYNFIHDFSTYANRIDCKLNNIVS